MFVAEHDALEQMLGWRHARKVGGDPRMLRGVCFRQRKLCLCFIDYSWWRVCADRARDESVAAEVRVVGHPTQTHWQPPAEQTARQAQLSCHLTSRDT